MPDASVLTMTFGTPIGTARIAAVPIVVPADPPSAKMPESSLIGEASRASRAAPVGGSRHGEAAVAGRTHRLCCCPREPEDLVARHVGRNGRAVQGADVDEHNRDAP